MKRWIPIVALILYLSTSFTALAGHVKDGTTGATQFYCETLADTLAAFAVKDMATAKITGPGLACYTVSGLMPVRVIKLAGIVYSPMDAVNIEVYKVRSPEGIVYVGVPEPPPEGEPA